MINKKVSEILGWYGVIAILLAYSLVSFNILNPNAVAYQILNLTGGFGIGISSLSKKAYPAATLNLIWAVVALVALLIILF